MEVAPFVHVNGTAQTYVDNLTYWPTKYRETEEFRVRLAECPGGCLAPGRQLTQSVLFFGSMY